jgi:hypothetical protein
MRHYDAATFFFKGQIWKQMNQKGSRIIRSDGNASFGIAEFHIARRVVEFIDFQASSFEK